jgi:Tfp pilus assembly protein PilV
MSLARRGALLPELLLALVLLGLGLAPAAWLFARAERLTSAARTRERVARAGMALLAESPALACGADSGRRDEPEVALRWVATGDSLRALVASITARAGGAADTLVTTVACP